MLEIFTVLTNGACICSASDELLQTTIANVINTLDINWTFMTPSMIRTVNPTEVPTLKTLALGGEALAKIDVTTWADKLHLFNGKKENKFELELDTDISVRIWTE